ncbi:alpha/beta fold hydrolase [Microbacterium terrisoli]|jgi:pimeloyl-ACP methyl ester carboxylesterase|uniref:alpha/beta fold hydrolase n=1 Tax=Microbacterium terrisoli TaxID=3242192 RepID=UPI0028040122|nr:alpha/beta hydrolase [Microbacterium protaetiae]
MSQTRIFEPDGRAIPYVDEGNGPGVVLMPASGLSTAYLSTLASMLVEADHRLVLIGSRRPAAQSPDAADTAVSMHDLAQDVIDVMDEIGLSDAWIGGHAFGGSIARTLALDHTDRVNGVLLLGVETAGAVADAEVLALDGEVAEVLDFARDAQVAPLQRAAREATPEAEWTTPAAHVPVLVIQASDDRITPPVNGERLRDAAPDRVSVVSVDGAGHLFPGTHAGTTAWAIEDYLDWD